MWSMNYHEYSRYLYDSLYEFQLLEIEKIYWNLINKLKQLVNEEIIYIFFEF